MLAALIASTAVAVLSLSAQVGPTIEFTDSSGTSINQVDLPNIGSTVDVQVHVADLDAPLVNVAQISIKHDPTHIAITHTCEGLFSGSAPWTDHNSSDGSTWFLCGITGSIGAVQSGQIMNLTISRVAVGSATLSFSETGTLPTSLFEPGVAHLLVPLGVLNIPDVAPTPTPTATVASGGGGGAPPPQPTATPSGPLLLAPGTPQNVSASAIVQGVTLNWDVPESDGGSDITDYRILVIPTGQVILVSAGQTQATINGLDPAVAYQFQINAVNSIGTGQGSGLTTAVSPLEPLTAPLNVVAAPGSAANSVVISWDAPLTAGIGPITGYTVISEPPVGNGVTVGATASSASFPGLGFSTTYTFKVLALSAAGAGPASASSNEVTTGAVSGSPGDLPIVPTTPAIEAGELELSSFEQAVSDAFGEAIVLSESPPSISTSGGGVLIEFPAEPINGGSSQTGSVNSSVGNLELDVVNGTGTATLSVGENVSITGTATLGTSADSVQVQIDDPVLMYTPPSPAEFSSGGGLVTHAGAEFGVQMVDLPSSIGLAAEFIDDVTQVPDAVTSFQLAASGSGGTIDNPATDIAFVVVVNKENITNDDLGDNEVTLTVSRAWHDDRVASGKQIVITKIGDDGVAYTAAASCVLSTDTARCTVVFQGDAGGFSIFSIIAVSSGTGTGQTPTPVPGGATATPSTSPVNTPAPVPTQVTGSPTSTPVPTPDVAPTATPLSALQPTAQPPIQGDPDEPTGGDGGFPLWAVLLIAIGIVGVLAPAAGAGYSIWRRQQIS